MAGDRYAVWGLDNLLSLESILILLNKNYNHSIDFLLEEDIEESDKMLYNKWLSPSSPNPLVINERSLYGQSVRYIHALGKYEYGYGVSKSFVNDYPLPKEVRVFNQVSNVLFFEYENKVYCVVETSASQESRIRSALFGQRKGEKMEEWGNIEFKKPLPFIFDSKFYYWLLSKKGASFTINTEKIELLDVSAISLFSERNVYESNSQGPDLLNGSVSALSGLGSNESVHSVGLKLKIGSTTLNIQVSANGATYIDTNRCTKIENDNLTSFNDDFSYFILLIYEKIFTELILHFEKDKSLHKWDDHAEALQRKTWALKVIKNLVEQNNIHIEELEIKSVKKEEAS